MRKVNPFKWLQRRKMPRPQEKEIRKPSEKKKQKDR